MFAGRRTTSLGCRWPVCARLARCAPLLTCAYVEAYFVRLFVVFCLLHQVALSALLARSLHKRNTSTRKSIMLAESVMIFAHMFALAHFQRPETFSPLEQFVNQRLQKGSQLHAMTFISLSQGAELRSQASASNVTEMRAEHHLVLSCIFYRHWSFSWIQHIPCLPTWRSWSPAASRRCLCTTQCSAPRSRRLILAFATIASCTAWCRAAPLTVASTAAGKGAPEVTLCRVRGPPTWLHRRVLLHAAAASANAIGTLAMHVSWTRSSGLLPSRKKKSSGLLSVIGVQ